MPSKSQLEKHIEMAWAAEKTACRNGTEFMDEFDKLLEQESRYIVQKAIDQTFRHLEQRFWDFTESSFYKRYPEIWRAVGDVVKETIEGLDSLEVEVRQLGYVVRRCGHMRKRCEKYKKECKEE